MKKLKEIYNEVINEDLEYAHSNTKGIEYDNYEIGMMNESNGGINIVYHGRRSKYTTPEELFNKINVEGGALLYGWGLYVTDNKEVAIEYSKNNYSNDNNKYIGLAMDLTDSSSVNKIISFFKTQGQWDTLPKEVQNTLLNNKNGDANNLIQNGYLYKMEINTNKKPYEWNEVEYNELSKKLGSNKAASQYLYNKGYYGIIVPNSGLAGNYKKGNNYTIFNPNDIKIIDIIKL